MYRKVSKDAARELVTRPKFNIMFWTAESLQDWKNNILSRFFSVFICVHSFFPIQFKWLLNLTHQILFSLILNNKGQYRCFIAQQASFSKRADGVWWFVIPRWTAFLHFACRCQEIFGKICRWVPFKRCYWGMFLRLIHCNKQFFICLVLNSVACKSPKNKS